MDLHDGFVLERYRLAIDRQRYFSTLARDAFAGYAKFFAVIASGAVALVSARESLGLDKELMPDLLRLLALVVTFLGAVAAVQIVFSLIRCHAYHRIQVGIDPATPRARRLWWGYDAIYLAVIVVSLLAAWRATAQLIADLARSAG